MVNVLEPEQDTPAKGAMVGRDIVVATVLFTHAYRREHNTAS